MDPLPTLPERESPNPDCTNLVGAMMLGTSRRKASRARVEQAIFKGAGEFGVCELATSEAKQAPATWRSDRGRNLAATFRARPLAFADRGPGLLRSGSLQELRDIRPKACQSTRGVEARRAPPCQRSRRSTCIRSLERFCFVKAEPNAAHASLAKIPARARAQVTSDSIHNSPYRHVRDVTLHGL